MDTPELILRLFELEAAIAKRLEEGKRIMLYSTTDQDLRLARLVQESQALKNKMELLMRGFEHLS